MSPQVKQRFEQALLQGAAPRTIGNYITELRRYEWWCDSTHVVATPLDAVRVLEYAAWRVDHARGPIAVPAFRAALRWAQSKFQLNVPDAVWEPLQALERQ
eukprot:1915151-Amphidinium_carterae.1